jgi:hypothetical protein
MSEYAQHINKTTNKPNYSGNAVTGSTLPLGYTFEESDHKNLQPFEGDVVLQGRFGQSVRFGSTVPSMKNSNNWSNSGNNGDPITILVNKQGRQSTVSPFDSIIENINIDGSSIYMTSTQEIIIKDLDEFPLNSFDTPINTTNKLLTKLSLAPITNNNIPAADQDKNSIK